MTWEIVVGDCRTGDRMNEYAQIARRVIDDAVNAGRLDGIGDGRLEGLERELAGEIEEAVDSFVRHAEMTATLGDPE
jgi:hypothetical protein